MAKLWQKLGWLTRLCMGRGYRPEKRYMRGLR